MSTKQLKHKLYTYLMVGDDKWEDVAYPKNLPFDLRHQIKKRKRELEMTRDHKHYFLVLTRLTMLEAELFNVQLEIKPEMEDIGNFCYIKCEKIDVVENDTSYEVAFEDPLLVLDTSDDGSVLTVSHNDDAIEFDIARSKVFVNNED